MVTSEIPVGAGLGSSAAYSVALAGAFHRLNVVRGGRRECGGEQRSTMELFAPNDQVIMRYSVNVYLIRLFSDVHSSLKEVV